MTSEYARDGEQQQQGDTTDDLQRRYRAIGIPAVNAAATMARRKREQQARQQQAMIYDYED